MCLTIPGKIESISKNQAKVSFGNKIKKVDLSLIDVGVGDYILEQNGFAVKKITKKEAEETLEFFKIRR